MIKEQSPRSNPIKLRSIAIKTDWKRILSMHDPTLATETLTQNITTRIGKSYETKKRKKTIKNYLGKTGSLNCREYEAPHYVLWKSYAVLHIHGSKRIIISCNHKDELLKLCKDNFGNELIKN